MVAGRGYEAGEGGGRRKGHMTATVSHQAEVSGKDRDSFGLNLSIVAAIIIPP